MNGVASVGLVSRSPSAEWANKETQGSDLPPFSPIIARNDMTKIEEYQKAKAIAAQVASATRHCLGRDSPRNDKHTFRCEFSHIVNQQWAPMCFQIEASYGYYGSSSGYSVTSETLGQYLAKAITIHAATLLDCATKLAADDAERARKAAEDEAKAVLQQAAA